MKENVWNEKQNQQLVSSAGRNVSVLEIKEIHQTLINQQTSISEEVADAIERNDYVKLSQLLVTRSKIQSAITEIESLHKAELDISVPMNDRIGKSLKDTVSAMESRGEDLLLNIINNLDSFNETAHSIVSKATLTSLKTFSRSNQLGHQAGKLIIHRTAGILSKLADTIQKRS
ncbi:hypothetical protein CJ195_19075 [Bacillus sp. UMB0899]|nr:hypothetical protein CJ195_19075 [Bacillus sp. UMB0899]